MTQIEIGELLRRYRIEALLTQKELADPMGYHNSVVSRVERGQQRPTREYLERFKKVLQLSEDERRGISVLCQGEPHSPPLPPPPIEEFDHFVVGPPIIYPHQFFGRERELKRIFGLWERFPLQNVAVIGPRRSGKTSLLHYLKNITRAAPAQLRPGQRADWLPQPERYQWILVDFQDARMCNREKLLRYLLAGLELDAPNPCNLCDFMDVVSDNLQTPALILMDEIGAALASPELDQPFWWSLRSLVSNRTKGNLGFLLTSPESPAQLACEQGKPSPFFNIFGHTIDLGPLDDTEARELIASSPEPFDPADVEWILAQSGRWPVTLQALCHTRLTALEDGKTDGSWRKDGLRQIKEARYQHLSGDQ